MDEKEVEKLKPFIDDWRRRMEISELKDGHFEEIAAMRAQHLQEIERAKLEARSEALEAALGRVGGGVGEARYSASPDRSSGAQETPSAIMLSAVIEKFMSSWPESKAEMLKKHMAALPMFLSIVGDKPISRLRQADLNLYFDTIQRLPPRWQDMCRKLKISVCELAQRDHDKVMAKATFDDSYKASMRLFLTAAVRDWQDQGFPTTLTTDGSEYRGTRVKSENKQRALMPDELKRLFEGDELRAFAGDPAAVHQFWLPVLGLYTGGRANELCQVNPCTDVFEHATTKIWCLNLTEDTEAADGIEKSIKTKEARVIPLHADLIALGFLDYVDALKRHGVKQLFPAWKARQGRAGANAVKWFSRFLDEIGLHGVENEKGLALRGMHAFRHTLLTYGKKSGLNLRPITGHAEHSENVVADGYEDDTLLMTLEDKRDRLNKLQYGLNMAKPVLPAIQP